MKKRLVAGAALLAIVSVSPPAVADPWNGFYLGINGGLATANDPTSEATALPGQFTPTFANAIYSHAPFGGLFGVQAGVNWHAAPSWVLGAEADAQKLWQSETVCTYGCLPASTPPALLAISDQQSLNWLVTVRPRLGWLSPGGSLWYVTGGAAWAQVNQAMTVIGAAGFFPGAGAFPTASASFTQVIPGWTIGAGIETPLYAGWSLKAEYLFVDLRTTVNGFTAPLGAAAVAAFPPSTTAVTASTSSVRDNIFRLGLNYQFGDPGLPAAAPIVPIITKAPAPAPAVQQWNGFYGGVNAGVAAMRDPTLDTTIFNPAAAVAFPVAGQDSFTHSAAGGLVGAQAGYDWRAARLWVVGLEGDWQWAHQSDTACISECLMPTLAGVPPGFIIPGLLEGLTDAHTLDWFSTARLRFGWVAPNDTLFYVTGGAAIGHVAETLNLVANPPFFAAGASGLASFSHILVGWTVGAGLEIPVWRNWTVKAEYLYVDLGRVTDSFTSALDVFQAPATSQTTTTSFSVHDHVARFGVNYHFN